MADDAGALLVRSGLVSASSLDAARVEVGEHGGTLGEHLVMSRAVDDDALTEFYRQRLLVPQVNPNTLARLPARVVASIPADMAIELRAVPVALDAENNLTVAMSDPSDRHAVDEIAFFTGAYVVRAVATQMQIAWCLAHYYGHVTQLGRRLVQANGDSTDTDAIAPVHPSPTPVPRPRGHTHKVEATRHRVAPPVTGAQQVARPSSKPLDDPTPAPSAPTQSFEPPTEPAVRAHRETAPEDDPAPPSAASSTRLRAQSQPVAPTTDGTVEQPRARSVSGEIRIPKQRAQSIKPELPVDDGLVDDDSPPVITIEVDANDVTGPRRPAPRRRPNQQSDPPELAARAGEVDSATGPIRKLDADEPRIVIADDAFGAPTELASRTASGEITRELPHTEVPTHPSIIISADAADPDAPVLIHDAGDQTSQPILLEVRRGSEPRADSEPAPPPRPRAAIVADDEVVMLDARKRPRPERRTVIGMGATNPPTRREPRDTAVDGPVPSEIDDEPTGPAIDQDTTRLDTLAAPPSGRPETTEETLAAPPSPTTPRDDELAEPPRAAATRDSTVTTAVMPAESGMRGRIDYDPLDDGWGPPGTTIPPPLLGAIPGGVDDDAGSTIPIANVDSAPLLVAAPSPPEAARGTPIIEGSGQLLVRALEDATAQVIDLIHKLETAQSRDEVVEMMVAHLATTHHRAGFLVIKTGLVKAGELGVFSIVPFGGTASSATLRLDRPSTLADVVGTRLPYRGPMHDDASRTFLTSVLGACPAEILLVPVSVRERVVGVLFGEHRRRHTFDDQLALAARAAGQALERILKSRRN